jgi:hypothetical protein
VEHRRLDILNGSDFQFITEFTDYKFWTSAKDEFKNAMLPHITFTKAEWDDGSQLIKDSNGFIHLISSNKQIPEITVVSILEKPTACWAADGTVAGSNYFYKNSENQSAMTAQVFYTNYIQRFIDNIIARCK